MCIFMSLNLIYYGFIFKALQYILNISIYMKTSRNLSLSTPFLLKITQYISNYNEKCEQLDKNIRQKIYKL
jgi:hypothetical protein